MPSSDHTRRRVLVALASAVPALVLAARPADNAAYRPLRLSAVEGTGTQEVAARVLDRIYRRLGIAIHVEPMPSQRATAMLRHGDTDGEVARIADYFLGNESLLRIDPPFYTTITAVFAREDHAVAVRSREDLAGQRVGIVRGILHAQRAVEGLDRVERVNDYVQLYRMLDAGRLDLVVDTPLNHANLARRSELRPTTQVGVLTSTPLHHGLARRHAVLARRVGAEIAALSDAGELARLVADEEAAYLTPPPSPS